MADFFAPADGRLYLNTRPNAPLFTPSTNHAASLSLTVAIGVSCTPMTVQYFYPFLTLTVYSVRD